jgi:hypothetical protein
VCLWIPGLTGMGRGRGPAEWKLCLCGSPAWQALGAQACGVNVVQGCAGLGGLAQRKGDHECLYLWHGRHWGDVAQQSRDLAGLCRPGVGAWPDRDHKCLWIPNLKGSSHGDPAGLRILGVWDSTALVGQKSRAYQAGLGKQHLLFF